MFTVPENLGLLIACLLLATMIILQSYLMARQAKTDDKRTRLLYRLVDTFVIKTKR